MKKPGRIGLIHLALAVFVIALLGKTARVQLLQGKKWAASAVRQQSTSRVIPAPRGDILDARGQMLAQSRETVKLAVALPEVRNFKTLAAALRRAGVTPDWIARATVAKRRWVDLPGRYLAIDVAQLMAMRGVHSTPIIERSYAFSEGTRRIVGRVDADGRAVDGIELALDSLLRGVPGTATMMRDARDRRFESPDAPPKPAVRGNSVMLTINQELQEIAERALADAVERMSAEGGDIVVMDPRSGEVLAMASQRSDPLSTGSTALSDTYEPGSTMKPFIAATLMEKGKARESDVVSAHGGRWTLNGREIVDEHRADSFNLTDVIRYSSNIGIAQFAMRLTPREEFEALRDFGFGSPTGVTYPMDAAGTLHLPGKWSLQSPASLAMGYEVAVTPLQLVAAYVAIANGGELLEPTLVKEVRAPDGKVLYQHKRRVVRRVISPEVARRVREILRTVVEEGGTAKSADLGTFSLAGKTGTARRTVNGRYAPNQHIPTFVSLFPADNPQFVMLVKIDNPKGAYMGGLTAAPVTKDVVKAALASADASLDRRSLAASRREPPPSDTSAKVGLTVATRAPVETTTVAQREALRIAKEAADEDSAGTTPFVVAVPVAPLMKTPALAPRAVPDVRGLSVRRAVHALHAAGFRVKLEAAGAGETSPAAGVVAPAGTLVRLSPLS